MTCFLKPHPITVRTGPWICFQNNYWCPWALHRRQVLLSFNYSFLRRDLLNFQGKSGVSHKAVNSFIIKLKISQWKKLTNASSSTFLKRLQSVVSIQNHKSIISFLATWHPRPLFPVLLSDTLMVVGFDLSSTWNTMRPPVWVWT